MVDTGRCTPDAKITIGIAKNDIFIYARTQQTFVCIMLYFKFYKLLQIAKKSYVYLRPAVLFDNSRCMT